ncbi:Dol-P-Man:Man(5)GlcNAc(2)-PP-Dol alpha-1,3-mannosyltransferase [Cercospora beticola]|uniref:Dol-P-Man:Man(5)GlcNAc(2)-PP-Dol alpha-1,3-mannosyltransferase n=1 Tax=Cercospora beticola TaxID=122368 RepID=A0A2G5HQW0_CERBT|nr:Dol-P-Man:Man(5)GlcNAc(2)-PP-Dol alpha-1,3-mannosyltransferase [Cercospora beticola]PIA94931.1 Dol-P-Man:Man(5)GlcNAc(2)-PP-Dol alpha-1,3-mannosyltransferase [Cercospora beticola]WPB04660.1 hypothetical protein RHO25_009306 [Cercospora beticola]CAK1364409.1 unnamed protein product [Cercospora beticola]
MSKLSEPLKQFINAAHAKPNTIPAPKNVISVYERIASDAKTNKVGLPAWLCASTAATMTMNSPESLLELYRLASTSPAPQSSSTTNQALYTAELMREVALKCIGFNGVPRTINCLGAFHSGLPSSVQSALAQRQPRRNLSKSNIEATLARGNALWESIYRPFSAKLTEKLKQSHPDLPVHIIEAEYGCLFSDPPSAADPNRPDVGRVLTSVIAVACLRAQSGVGPQVVSHVFGLRKAFEDGSAESEDVVPGGKWLASNEGSLWLLEQVDRIVEAIGEGRGTTFAPGFEKPVKAKL